MYGTRSSYQALVVLGRGIEKTTVAGCHVWKPTRYVERLSPDGHHAGVRRGWVDLNDIDAVIAGGQANVLAAFHMYAHLGCKVEPPIRIVFAAGKPAYLSQEATSEGAVMAQAFLTKIRAAALPVPEIHLEENNRNSRDDIARSLGLAVAHGTSPIAFVTVALHIPRCRKLHSLIVESDPVGSQIAVDFIASEDVLRDRYGQARYSRMFRNIEVSQAYLRTLAMEQAGLRALDEGVYDLGSQGYAFAWKDHSKV